MRSVLAASGARHRGMALITSLLLLLVVTILAVSMFRSFGLEGRIAGNVREKQRALMAAEAAQQYAEWWLAQANQGALGGSGCSAMLNANNNESQVCTNPLTSVLTAGTSVANVNTWPYWTTYTPPSMTVQANTAGTYFQAPGFYITYLGTSTDGTGSNVYQIDAKGYGADANTVAVVESTFEVKVTAPCYTGNPESPTC
ncbi:MAG TPA: PilX N-terminal domain-containing pilus assembly protein [Steroidobacteraceae bacterium]|nr:PilX N-terminal domain-containing pilus assembly protein [Steroidobacteraceae bacterium]